MERELSHSELQELLGAHALDALDDDERDAVEQHLQYCPRCRAAAGDFREVAAFMAHGGGAAPDGLWEKIAGALEEAPPPLTLAPYGGAAPGPARPPATPAARKWKIIAAAASVAAALAVGALGARVVDDNRPPSLSALDAMKIAAADAFSSPNSTRVDMRSADGRYQAEAVVDAQGRGYLLRTDLPALPSDRTYQLWLLRGAEKISAGVLGTRPDVVAFTAVAGRSFGLAITNEVAGGVPATTNDPVVVGTV